ncbi:MAG: polymerase sigma-70 factor [Gemmatimonadetes bacterium]|nr:polymerase sigma-70 factor [Gemmatimonadota bacterium]
MLAKPNDIHHVDEAELLTRLRQGDDDAYSAIFREHYPMLVVTATRLLTERALAEEIAQDVMLELWRRRESLVLTGPVRAYLQQATRNRALNRIRQSRTAQRGEVYIKGPSESPPSDSRAIAGELQMAVAGAIASLSEPQREVFEMNRTKGLTYGEIAELLGISVKSVEARMGRALKQLREQLAPWLPDGGGW